MARFFAKEAGARVMVQGFGEATAANAVEVPESIAAELSKHPGLISEAVPEIATPKRNKPAKGEKE